MSSISAAFALFFRMPDVTTIAFGGGTLVDPDDPRSIGTRSLGHRLEREARVFGGETLTLSDVAVAAGLVELGNRDFVADLAPGFVAAVLAETRARIADAVDHMLPGPEPVPLIAVGGGAFLVPNAVEGISAVRHVPHHDVANAVGAAIAQVSGEINRIYQDLPRAEAAAAARAVEAGADPQSIQVVDREDIPMAYMPDNTLRVRLKVVGGLA